MSAFTLTRIAALASALILSACGGGSDDAAPTAPEITSCSTVRQGNCTFQITGCQGGASSFNTTISQTSPQGQTCTADYRVTCASGCLATVSER